jgi:RNA 2',3'-cyclic 3'-phosphodiesterase
MGRQFDFLGGGETQHNVFFAAVLDAAMSASAGEVARNARRRLGLSGAPISPERLHVSLLSVGGFSGSCPPALIDAAMRAAGVVSMAPFRAEFDRVASFSGQVTGSGRWS